MKNLYLLFPQWQGSGKSKELYHGAKLLHNILKSDFSLVEIEVSLAENLSTQNNILGYDIIKKQLKSAIKTIKQNRPEKIFTIGGDCSIELAPISYLNKKLNGNIGVIWFDAHGDLNTPVSSLSKEFHGMPLRILLDNGDDTLREIIFSKLNPNQIFLAGVRDLDFPEEKYIQTNNISTYSIESLFNDKKLLIDAVRAKGFEKIYIHVDLDVLDPYEFPNVKCPVAQGLSLECLIELICQIKNNFSIIGAAIVEFSPKEERSIEAVTTIVHELFEK